MTPLERTRAIEKKMKEISLAEEKKNPGKRAEVSEMFLGKNYVLFLLHLPEGRAPGLRAARGPGQVRGRGRQLDLAPAFGGLRLHAGLCRSRRRARPNTPPTMCPTGPRRCCRWRPTAWLTRTWCSSSGTRGRTYRHRPAAFLAYLAEVYMPCIVDWYGWQIDHSGKPVRREPMNTGWPWLRG